MLKLAIVFDPKLGLQLVPYRPAETAQPIAA
jgi:hypothetical protein